jgi:hypothetical protein
MLLVDWWPLGRFDPSATQGLRALSRLAREKTPFFLLALASCVVTYLAQRAQAVISLEHHPLDLRIGNALFSYGRYLLKAFWPSDMAII